MYQSLIALFLTVGLTASAASLRLTITPEPGSDTTQAIDCVMTFKNAINRDAGAGPNDKVSEATVVKMVTNGSEKERRQLTVKVGYSEEQLDALLATARAKAITSMVSFSTPADGDKIDIHYTGVYKLTNEHFVNLHRSNTVIGERSNRSAEAIKLRELMSNLCAD